MYQNKFIFFLISHLQKFSFSSLVYILLITKFTRFFDGKLISQMKRVKKEEEKRKTSILRREKLFSVSLFKI